MNERIKELVEKANIEFTYDPTETPMRAFVECWEDELDKFAQLIVEECVAQCWSVSELEHKGSVVSECSKRMRKHFGVEV